MFTISPRWLGSKVMRVASALVAAGLTAGLLAAVALAAPNDVLPSVDGGANHDYQWAGQDLGQDDCVPGAAPTTDGDLNWRENAAQTQVTPLVTGTICLQNTTHEARMVLEYRDNNHVVLARYPSNVARGNGSKLNTFNVDLSGPQVTIASMNHVHVYLEERPIGGAWSVVSTSIQDY
jgi:hypothetical protein